MVKRAQLKMNYLKVFLLALALHTFLAFAEHHLDGTECTHGQEEFEPELLEVDDQEYIPEGDGRMLGSSSYPKIRLYQYYGLMKGGSKSFRSYAQYDLIPPVMDYFESALRIKHPLKAPLKVGPRVRTMCGHKTPKILQTTGVNTDYFIFFTVESLGSSFVATSRF